MAEAPQELVELARDWLNAGLNRDTDFIRRFSHAEDDGFVHTIASPPGAHFTLDEFASHLGEVPPRYSVESQPRGFVHGDMAYMVDFPTIDMRHDGVLDGRHTLVMRRVEGVWKVVHSHISEGVDRQL